jgi:pimeloyl-ACP methyl ester carboxylesterase
MRNLQLALVVVLAVVLAPVAGYAQSRTTRPAGKSKAPAKPPVSIVLVHGAWADGSSWDKVVPQLEQKGYSVVVVHLPLTSSTDDIAATTRAIDRQLGDVVLVGHSYGGFVITRAGNNPKVKRLVYVDAFALDEGETANALFKVPPPWVKTLLTDSGGYVLLPFETIVTMFAQDLTLPEQRMLAAKQGPVPVANFNEPMIDPAWRKKPSWYVRGTQDKFISAETQAQMAKRAKAIMVSLEAGHLSILSKPREVAAVILDAASSSETAARK